MSKVYEFTKVGKTTVTLDENFIRIKRAGLLNLANHGLDGEKAIHLSSITGVQLKKATSLTNGYLQLIVKGSKESKKGLFAATQDENTIMFNKKENSMAEEIEKYIEDAITNNTKPSVVVQKADVADEIRKFKELLDEGIITEEEFARKKSELLGL